VIANGEIASIELVVTSQFAPRCGLVLSRVSGMVSDASVTMTPAAEMSVLPGSPLAPAGD